MAIWLWRDGNEKKPCVFWETGGYFVMDVAEICSGSIVIPL